MYRPLSAALATAVVAAAALGLTGCPGQELTCVEVEPACTPLYEPTFANVFAITLEEKCSVSNACHAGPSPKGGLDLSDPERAYAGLLDADQGRVLAGDASCSELIERVTTTLSEFQMPPGANSHLSAAEVCALQQWVAAGAPGQPLDAGVDAP